MVGQEAAVIETRRIESAPRRAAEAKRPTISGASATPRLMADAAGQLAVEGGEKLHRRGRAVVPIRERHHRLIRKSRTRMASRANRPKRSDGRTTRQLG